MADNTVLNSGTGGDTIASDDIGGIKHQRVKISLGADGAATDALGGSGVMAAGVMRVTIATDDALVLQTADYDTGVGTDTAVMMGIALPASGGAVAGGTSTDPIRVDPTGTTAQPVTDNSGSLTVDNAGTFAVQATVAASATNIAKAEDAASANADVGVPALAVQKATPANTAGTDGDYEFLQMSAGRLWTSATIDAAIPAGTNAIGKLAANSGVDIGDVDITSVVPGTGATNLGKAEDGAHTSGDVGVMALAVRNDTPNAALAGTDLDYTPIGVYRDGSLRLAPPESDFAVLGSNSVKKYFTSAGAATDGIVWSPAVGKRWYVTDIFINVSAAATVTLEDDLVAGDSAVWKAELAANSGWSHSFSTPLFSGEDAADLLVTTSAGNVYITVTGYEI